MVFNNQMFIFGKDVYALAINVINHIVVCVIK